MLVLVLGAGAGGISKHLLHTAHTDRLLLLAAATLTPMLPNPTLATLLCHLTQLLHTLLDSAQPSLHQPATLLDPTLAHSPQFYSTMCALLKVVFNQFAHPLLHSFLGIYIFYIYNSVPLFNSNTYKLFITISLLYSTKLVLRVYLYLSLLVFLLCCCFYRILV